MSATRLIAALVFVTGLAFGWTAAVLAPTTTARPRDRKPVAIQRRTSPSAQRGERPQTRPAASERADAANGKRDAETILQELSSVSFPQRSDGASPEAIHAYFEAVHNNAQKQIDLAWELYHIAPEHPQTAKHVDRRWAAMENVQRRSVDVLAETGELLAHETREPIRTAALLARAWSALSVDSVPYSDKLQMSDAAAAAAPHDARAALNYIELASAHATSVEEIERLTKLAEKYWVTFSMSSDTPKNLRARLAAIGKSVELEFDDLLTGNRVSILEHLGRPGIVILWDGDDAPFRAAWEWVSRRRADLEARGVFFVGVYLWRTDGGADSVREKARALGLTCPQYYDGKGFDTFDQSWGVRYGVTHAPHALLVGRDGTLRMSSRRPECLIPALEAELARGSAPR